jgi:EAL domain-containing protein (putative c-di-GMP-specific phosphodiesterase class I)
VKPSCTTFTLQEIVAGITNNEFEAFLQPKVSLRDGIVQGAEALARWRHPQYGIVPPSAFIKTLEDNDLIDQLTWVMLAKAASFCRASHAAGMNVKIAVNLSVKSLADVRIADRVTQLVRSHDVEPRELILEVTESAATTDVATALENLARLRMKGFGLSIDDYGTGYSSMKQLTRIAFTEIKIDQSFVTNAAKHEAVRVILESSINMARKLKVTSVAEGVETEADWKLLHQLGCDLAQGYLISPPMECSAYLKWVEEWNTRSHAGIHEIWQ